MNYSHLPRSGLPSPRLLRWELPISVSELAPQGTVVPDSAGDFPLRAVRSVPLLPDGHSIPTSGACVFLHSNTGRIGVSVLLPISNVTVVRLWRTVKVTKDVGRIPTLLTPFGRSFRMRALPACNSGKSVVSRAYFGGRL